MSDAKDRGVNQEELEHLRVLQEAETGASMIGGDDPSEPMRIVAHRMLAGAPAPAFNPGAHSEYYRLFFAGVLVFVGCLMPFGPQPQPGYYSVTGGLMLFLAIGLIWSMWGAINTGLFRRKWAILMVVPFVWSLLHVLGAFSEPAVSEWITSTPPELHVESWRELAKTLVTRSDPHRFHKVGEFLRMLGPGKVLICAGSVLAEIYLLVAVFRGVQRSPRRNTERRTVARSR